MGNACDSRSPSMAMTAPVLTNPKAAMVHTPVVRLFVSVACVANRKPPTRTRAAMTPKMAGPACLLANSMIRENE